MIIEPSLMKVMENLLTNPKYDDSYLEGMCELVKDKVIHFSCIICDYRKR